MCSPQAASDNFFALEFREAVRIKEEYYAKKNFSGDVEFLVAREKAILEGASIYTIPMHPTVAQLLARKGQFEYPIMNEYRNFQLDLAKLEGRLSMWNFKKFISERTKEVEAIKKDFYEKMAYQSDNDFFAARQKAIQEGRHVPPLSFYDARFYAKKMDSTVLMIGAGPYKRGGMF